MANPYPHYVWAAGHFLLLLSTLRYYIAWATFKSAGYGLWYKAGFIGALTSYSIVVYKSLGTPQPNKAYIQKALADENFQYFLLAIFWFFNKPVPLALIPYATFSLFHALTFTRTNILPRIFPPAPPAPGQERSSSASQHPLAKTIHGWVKANYDPAMEFVAWAEIAILSRVVVGALVGLPPLYWLPFFNSFRNSLVIPLVFAHFLRLRFYHSAFIRKVVTNVDARVTALVNQPGQNPQIKQAWDTARGLVTRWGGSIVQPAPAPAAAAR
ncbi:hypothetical protein FRC03_000121 [Tulasnella sp. 419]|nr:hypothetical protein FRC03_000121 [Tulasnella sp. 419]